MLVLHLLFCIEGVEVVVIGELSAAGNFLKCKEANSVHPIHRPEREKSRPSRVSGCSIHMMIINTQTNNKTIIQLPK